MFAEILGAVIPWDREWSTTDDPTPLWVGIHCAKGRHRAFASTLLAAEALRAMGYSVYTEAPDTRECGCPGWCTTLADQIHPTGRRPVLRTQFDKDAKLARDMAIGTLAIQLSIIRRCRWCGEGRGGRRRGRAPPPSEEVGGRG